MRLIPGKSYYIKYEYYHTDPLPYLFVTWSDAKYTSGFNLHYLPYARYRRSIDAYKKVNRASFDKWLKESKEDKVFGMFFDTLGLVETKEDEDGIETRPNIRMAKTAVLRIQKKMPWAMSTYRIYKSEGITGATIG